MVETRLFDLSITFQDYDFETPEAAAEAMLRAVVELATSGIPIYVDATDTETGTSTVVEVKLSDVDRS